MADANAQVQVVVNGQDNTKGMFQQLGANVQQLNTNTSSLTKAMASLGLAGIGAYAAMTLMRDGFDFLKDSIGAAVDQSATLAQMSTYINNAGLSFADAQPKLEEYGAVAVKLGFQEDDAMLSASRLTIATHDLGQATTLSAVAMDLARAKGMDLNQATTMLLQVIDGNSRALKAFGIELKDGASAAENLTKLQDALKDSAVNFASTAAGKIEILNAEWHKMEEQVGNELLPVLIEFMATVEQHMPEITNVTLGVATALVKVAQAAVIAGDAYSGAWTMFKEWGADTTGTVVDWTAKIGAGWPFNSTDSNQVSQNVADLGKNLHAVATDDMNEAAKKGNDLQNAINGIASSAVATGPGVDQMTKDWLASLQKIGDGYGNLGTAASDAAKQIEKDFETIAKAVQSSINDQEKDIDDLQNKLTDLDASLQDDLDKAKSDYQKQTEQLVRTTNTQLQDIYKQEGTETDPAKLKDLQDQASKLQQILTEAQSVVDVTGTLMKDDMQTLTSSYDEQVTKIKADNWAAEQKAGLQMGQDQNNLANLQTFASNPANYGGDVNKLLAQIGVAGGGNGTNFVFNFNGDITDKAEFIKQIKEFFSSSFNLNRTVAK